MKIYYTFLTALFFLGVSMVSAQSKVAPNSPNVIIIFADDLGYGDLGCYGSPTIHTPRLDQMAREGIKLTSFYVAASVCTPSRAGLITGRYPIRFGMERNQGPDSEGGMPAEEQTLAEALKAKGYRTAAFGKWHLGSTPGFFPTDHGFDEYLGILYSNDMMPPWVKTERPLHLYRNSEPTKEYPVDQTTLTKRYTDETIRFIKEGKGQPFFIYIPLAMPHLPISASKDFLGKSKGGLYGDVIEEIDWNVGRLLDFLADSGLDKNTLVVFTSDNGPWNRMPPRMYDTEPVEKWHGGSTGPLNGTKGNTLEGGFRVPAILHWPGQIPSGQVSAEMVNTFDIHATILSLAKAPQPTLSLDGRNIWSTLSKGESPSSKDFYYFRGKWLEGIRSGDWKFRITQSRDKKTTVQLFNLMNDPFERLNMAEEHPELIVELKKKMIQFATETNAQIILQP